MDSTADGNTRKYFSVKAIQDQTRPLHLILRRRTRKKRVSDNNNKKDGENIEAKKVVERTFAHTTFSLPLIA